MRVSRAREIKSCVLCALARARARAGPTFRGRPLPRQSPSKMLLSKPFPHGEIDFSFIRVPSPVWVPSYAYLGMP